MPLRDTGYTGLSYGMEVNSYGMEVNSSPPGQNGRHFADDMFKCIFLNGNI